MSLDWIRNRKLTLLLLLSALFALVDGPITFAGTTTKERALAAIPKLEMLAKKAVASDGVPGLAIAIVHGTEVIYLGGFGVRKVGQSETVNADTVFQLASLSKPISSTVVAALVSDGLVEWESRIADLDGGFQLNEAYPTAQVTIRDLFAHRSGLSGNAGNDLEGLGYSRDEILHRLRYLKPASSFRSAYAYSNFGLTEGAVAAVKPTGKAWADVAEERLYKPLGMHSTSSRHADFVRHDNRSALHVRIKGKWTALVTRNPDPQSPAGGVSSNARDLAQWMLLELGNGELGGKRLIAAVALAQTHVPLMERGSHAITGAASFYGLGWNVNFGRYGTIWKHAGAFSQGARTVGKLLPSEQLGIVVLSNAFPTGIPDAMADSYFDLVFAGSVTRDWVSEWNAIYASIIGPSIKKAKELYGTPPVSPVPPLPLSAYAGTYANDYLGNAVVVAERGGLTLKLGPKGDKRFALSHFDRDTFTYFADEETPDVPGAVIFQIGPDRRANQVTIEDLNDQGQGVLPRAN